MRLARGEEVVRPGRVGAPGTLSELARLCPRERDGQQQGDRVCGAGDREGAPSPSERPEGTRERESQAGPPQGKMDRDGLTL